LEVTNVIETTDAFSTPSQPPWYPTASQRFQLTRWTNRTEIRIIGNRGENSWGERDQIEGIVKFYRELKQKALDDGVIAKITKRFGKAWRSEGRFRGDKCTREGGQY